MPAWLDRLIAVFLFVVHSGLLVWALIGLAELFVPAVRWAPISNPLFSPGTLLLQWTLVAGAALTFLFGWSMAWSPLRQTMACWYAAMALTCAWQTFFILENDSRFVAMAIEYAEYAAILAWLFLSPLVTRRIGPGTLRNAVSAN